MQRTVATVAGALSCLPLMVGMTAFSSGTTAAAACLPTTVSAGGSVPAAAGLDAEQQASARIIVATTVGRRMPSRAAVIAVATAMQESTLRNIAYGDRDSLGLFQQRPSQGWGTPLQVLDPVYATNKFLDGLREIPDWPVLPLTVAAQAVQRSAFPAAYAKWEPDATAVVAGLLGRPGVTAGDDGVDAVDTPGLLVLGDALAESFAGGWPARFQGGTVELDIDADRTPAQALAALRRRQADLPGTIVVSLGGRGVSGPRVAAVLRAAGAERSVYWLTSPLRSGARSNEVLRAAARDDGRLHLIDLEAAARDNAARDNAARDNAARDNAARDNAARDNAARDNAAWVAGGRLTDAGVDGVSALVLRSVGVPAPADPAAGSLGPGCDDGFGGYGAVPVADCAFTMIRANPRGCQDAVRWALAQTDGPAIWYRRCLNFVAQAHGYAASGVPTAAGFWRSAEKHPGDANPPAGALVFWDTGDPAGHVALSAGGGMVISTDVGGPGTISAISLDGLRARWGATYLGWAPPYFPRGV